jgi:hypothetical protein
MLRMIPNSSGVLADHMPDLAPESEIAILRDGHRTFFGLQNGGSGI